MPRRFAEGEDDDVNEEDDEGGEESTEEEEEEEVSSFVESVLVPPKYPPRVDTTLPVTDKSPLLLFFAKEIFLG